MFTLKILNSKQVKELMGLIDEQWGSSIKLDYAFLMNNRDRVFVVNRSIGGIDFSRLRINSVGMYFAEYKNGSVRLSIEGSQVIGPHAKKNVVELSEDEMKSWLR